MIHGRRECYWGVKKAWLLQFFSSGEALIYLNADRRYELVPFAELSFR